MKPAIDVAVMSPDGKEELAIIPAVYMEAYMTLEGIKGRSKKDVEKAALALMSEIVKNAEKLLPKDKKKSKKKSKKISKKKGKK